MMKTVARDHRGIEIHVGSRVRATSYGYGIPLWLMDTEATVVGFGRTRVRIKFDQCAYDDKFQYHTAAPEHLRSMLTAENIRVRNQAS